MSMYKVLDVIGKLPNEFEAYRWFSNGDHPEDDCKLINVGDRIILSDGKIVRRYHVYTANVQKKCKVCGNDMKLHGVIVQNKQKNKTVVYPGDYIVTLDDNYLSVKPNVINSMYEEYEKIIE